MSAQGLPSDGAARSRQDNTSAREFTLADLAHVHTLCDLPEPLELRLKPGDIRFKQRIEMIKGMRDVMDGEESVGDVDELENDQAAHTEMHDASFSDGGYVESGDEEEPEVTCECCFFASLPLH